MSNTLGTVLISYDLANGHTLVKQSMLSKGYYDGWQDDLTGSHKLPNTTLWKPNTSTDQALSDLRSACSEAAVGFSQRAVAVLATNWVGA